ncbi:discoidin domain-containing protein [Sinomicrobium weinanense]|uniref:Discoidin domain-containing protein n=1 Tax=Sinomicrobium weinanense TaxID=2842200 RepID=A0A926Q304_9FLAO|nr:discoidin domain-containing protein [Sinomicrobium weinanense]MBC9797152.1 discoidin domain-containing protein [Sinomicrobium weinanense]MBU3124493.1 discoidin domain-containing protein [Sinomicrobium weinanense]
MNSTVDNWNNYYKYILVALAVTGLMTPGHGQENNLSRTGTASSSTAIAGYEADRVADGKENTLWKSGDDDRNPWVIVRLPGATEIVRIGVRSVDAGRVVTDFSLQFMHNGKWHDVRKISGNTEKDLKVDLDKPVLSDRIRFIASAAGPIALAELELFGQAYVDSSAMVVKKILVNQSGYNLNHIKRFSAPDLSGQVGFQILELPDGREVYQGEIQNGVGDFSDFDPESEKEYVIEARGHRSFPFRIGPNWLERVTYRNMVDFMAGARHYLGTTDQIRPLSWAWRDGDFFNWAQQSLVSLYLSNPAAFDRMERTLQYVPNEDFPEDYRRKWGALEPYAPDAPDIVKLIHWDADVKISQELDHEMQKAELAYFLYAWPYLKQWLPRQNFDRVYAYLKEKWSKNDVEEHSTTKYDLSPGHDLLALKTKLGTTKGELPPGHSVIPNLMMYEVAKSQGEDDAEKYFQAAYDQLDWMIKNLDWEDPITTKGQRMSEHITMRAFAYFFHEYPGRAPDRIRDKVEKWARVAISRSDNFWDFRKYSPEDWTPPSWNETGNVLGFPAAVFSAMGILENGPLCKRLEVLAWAHLENAFGRNPTGRHFSYRGTKEIEGVDLGWYSTHKGGIGLLEKVRFVFDGSPKSFHYPNHPEVGNLGWTEGWVQFNTAFNLSMAYLANYNSNISLNREGDELTIALKAPLNFDYGKEELLELELKNKSGGKLKVVLREASPYSDTLVGKVKVHGKKLVADDGELQFSEGDTVTVSYGLGFMKNEAELRLD